MKKNILFVIFACLQASGLALSCYPLDCTPGCNSSCSYQACTQSKIQILDIKNLPVIYEQPKDNCQPILYSDLSTLPLTINGQKIDKLPASIKINYLTCENRTKYGSPCPPSNKE